MHIKIHTYNFTSNYGAVLQAFSLGYYLNSLIKSEVTFSSFHPYKLKYYEFIRPLLSKKPNKVFGHFKKNIEILNWRRFYLKELSQNKDFSAKDINFSIYGSDEIWNFLNPYYGFSDFFFGGKAVGKKIAYAASIGKATYNDLTQENKKKITYLLNDYNSISVRDDNTAEFVNKLTGRLPEIVVDPTLLSNHIFFNSSNKINSDKKFAVIYGLNFTDEEIKKIKDFCNKKKLEIISLGYFNSWVSNNKLGLNPSDFYEYIKKSSCVFTSMFHGIILSIKSNKNFWYTVDPIRIFKVKYIISKFHLENRNLSNIKNLEGEIDYKELNKVLEPWINKSREFLSNSIKQ